MFHYGNPEVISAFWFWMGCRSLHAQHGNEREWSPFSEQRILESSVHRIPHPRVWGRSSKITYLHPTMMMEWHRLGLSSLGDADGDQCINSCLWENSKISGEKALLEGRMKGTVSDKTSPLTSLQYYSIPESNKSTSLIPGEFAWI